MGDQMDKAKGRVKQAAGDLTERYEDNNTSGLNSIAIGDAPGAASVAANWDGSSVSDPHGVISINLNQATAATASLPPQRQLIPHLIGR